MQYHECETRVRDPRRAVVGGGGGVRKTNERENRLRLRRDRLFGGRINVRVKKKRRKRAFANEFHSAERAYYDDDDDEIGETRKRTETRSDGVIYLIYFLFFFNKNPVRHVAHTHDAIAGA